MVNQIHFGKRIAALRRKAGWSQSDLAERLGVTSQAVSKWETGNAMPDIDYLLELSQLYRVTINEMLEGSDLLFQLTGKKTEPSGIAYFVSKQEREYNREWAERMHVENWIRQNWDYVRGGNGSIDTRIVSKQIAECDGIILEIGVGPGGGYMPYVLGENPDVTLIISDLSPTVVREWKDLLDHRLGLPNLYYAVFDFCNMPFQDGCIDMIADRGGIGNCEGEKQEALKEAYRVLKPGGKLITTTGFVTKDTLAELPEMAQKVLGEKRPDIFEDLYEETVLAGFSKIDSMITGYWYTDDDESMIADLAKSLGVNLKFTSYVRFCEKVE